MNYTKHKSAIVETTHIGGNTCISAYTHVLPNTEIGNNCYIEDHVVVDDHVIIGNNVKIKTGTKICEGVQIEDDVFIGPNVIFTNDNFPKSKPSPKKYAAITLRKGASIAANATILPGIQIGQYAIIGAGAVVTRSIPPYAIVVGNPAKITGYIDTERQLVDSLPISHENKIESKVRGVFLKQVKMVEDLRGDITVTELAQDIPFQVRRMFFVYNVPDERVRGEHVHKKLQEFIICLKGAFSIVVDDRETKEEYRMDKPNLGIYIPPTVWRSLYKFSHDAVLAVYASHEYDPTDYIRDYNEFYKMAE